MNNDWKQLPDGYLNKTPIFQFLLLAILFPLWGAAASLNDILITQFKSVFSLSDFATALVQSAFYGGYFLVALPSSIFIKKTSYKMAILVGLCFYIIGCCMFYPASHMATYTLFLAAILVIALGLGFLETAANTYSTMLGAKEKATLRLNISQTFLPIGSITGILLGKYLIFQEGESMSVQIARMSIEQAHAFRLDMLMHTLEPYRILIFILIVAFALFFITKFPSCKPEKEKLVDEAGSNPGVTDSLKYLLKNKRFTKGIMAQFLYVGMQVAVWSFTIRLILTMDKSINERAASDFMIYSFIAFFIGRFIATLLISRFSSNKVLCIYSLIGSFLLAYIVVVPNVSVIYAAVAVSAFFGPCFASIYAQTLNVVDKKYTETAGAVLIMTIIGGAILPAIQGFLSDFLGSMQLSFSVALICFIYIAAYFYSEINVEEEEDKNFDVQHDDMIKASISE
jgi:FHS family L-fucose permease-like MFS transporter